MDVDLDCEAASSERGNFLLGRELKLTVHRSALPIPDAVVLPPIVAQPYHRDDNGSDLGA